MFNQYLKTTNPKATEYFENLLLNYQSGKKNIPNSIILWGSDSLAQYLFAIEIARHLNCKNNNSIDCDCISCNWIRSNTHPEIKTISKINSKPSKDETKVISVKQIQELLSQINTKSNDYRVIILCDADFEKISEEKEKHIENFGELKEAIAVENEKYWQPKPLNSRVFQEESANALLKTIEETPEKLLFIFLTTSPDDLISTIISRSQMFYIQNTFVPNYDFSFCQKVFNKFPNFEKEKFFDFTQLSMDYMKLAELNFFDYLELLQAYMTELLAKNYDNNVLKSKILLIIDEIVQAKKYQIASVKTEYILDNFWINIS